MTSFENHVHAFKRTKPLKGNAPVSNGTVYVGDGSFGAIVDEMCKPDSTVNIFEKALNQNNFWLSVVDHQNVTHVAYNNSGHIIDSFWQATENYALTTQELLM